VIKISPTFPGGAALPPGADQTVGPVVADLRAYGLLQGTLEQQSAAFSYVDVFRFLALACFVCSLIVFLMKRVRPKKGGPAMAH